MTISLDPSSAFSITMPATRRRGMMFTDESVRAILAGNKTQTRRLVKIPTGAANVRGWTDYLKWGDYSGGPHGVIECPHGAVGDRIWVREAWARVYDAYPFCDGYPSHIEYRADGDPARFPGDWPPETADDPGRPRWRLPYFLKRADSRITLEITDVRVERLHDISPVDIRAEGVFVDFDGTHGAWSYFVEAWNKINGKRTTWASNPWVWVLSFIKIAG